MITVPAWRSLLFVPANAQSLLSRAHLRGADALILDLEDGVDAADKLAARTGLADVLSQLTSKGSEVLVRINAGWLDSIEDIKAAVSVHTSALMVPKVENASRLEVLAQMVSEVESARGLPVGKIKLVALIESPRGVLCADSIAATRGVCAIALGSEDFCLSLGVPPSSEALDYPCRHLALAASNRGVQCISMPASIANFKDLDTFGMGARRGAAIGCTGALCVHPGQVPVVNQAFAPSETDAAHARGIVNAWEMAQQAGQAVSQLDGVMVDKPVYERAKRLLVRMR